VLQFRYAWNLFEKSFPQTVKHILRKAFFKHTPGPAHSGGHEKTRMALPAVPSWFLKEI